MLYRGKAPTIAKNFENSSKPVFMWIWPTTWIHSQMWFTDISLCDMQPRPRTFLLYFFQQFAPPSHKVTCVYLPSPLKKSLFPFFLKGGSGFTQASHKDETTGMIENLQRKVLHRNTLVVDLPSDIFSMSPAKELLNCSVS